jgi:hypothetical protein
MPVEADVTDALIVHVAPAARLAPESTSVVLPGLAVRVPPVHVVVAFGVAAILTFAGKPSLSPIDESATAFVAVFAIEIVSVDVPFTGIATGEKLFASVTAETLPMLSTADAGAVFVAPCVEPNAFAGIVFVEMPLVLLVTVTTIVQVAFAATLPFASATVDAPAVAVTVPAPQVVDAFGVGAIVMPAGNVSASVMPESGADPVAVFATEIVSVEVPPGAIVMGENAFASVTFGAAVSVLIADVPVWFA